MEEEDKHINTINKIFIIFMINPLLLNINLNNKGRGGQNVVVKYFILLPTLYFPRPIISCFFLLFLYKLTMAGSVNKVILLGNLGKDPEIRSMQSGSKMANFSIATSKRWKDRSTQEQKEKTSWHNIVIFGDGLVDIVEKYVKKGSKVYVEGELQTRKWQDQDGKDRYSTEVILQGYNCNLTLLDSRNQSNTIENQSNSPQDNSVSDDGFGSNASDSSDLDEDIPF